MADAETRIRLLEAELRQLKANGNIRDWTTEVRKNPPPQPQTLTDIAFVCGLGYAKSG